MREIRTSGSMSGEGKRSVGRMAPSNRASLRLYHYSMSRGRIRLGRVPSPRSFTFMCVGRDNCLGDRIAAGLIESR